MNMLSVLLELGYTDKTFALELIQRLENQEKVSMLIPRNKLKILNGLSVTKEGKANKNGYVYVTVQKNTLH